MNKTVFIEFDGVKSAWAKTSLSKFGHTDHNIDKVYTFRNAETKPTAGYVAIECFNVPTPAQIVDYMAKIGKLLQIKDGVHNSTVLEELLGRAKNKEDGAKLKFWFDHATFVSPSE